MHNKTLLPYPPEMEDTALYSYLFQLVEQLNICLGAVDAQQITGETVLNQIKEQYGR